MFAACTLSLGTEHHAGGEEREGKGSPPAQIPSIRRPMHMHAPCITLPSLSCTADHHGLDEEGQAQEPTHRRWVAAPTLEPEHNYGFHSCAHTSVPVGRLAQLKRTHAPAPLPVWVRVCPSHSHWQPSLALPTCRDCGGGGEGLELGGRQHHVSPWCPSATTGRCCPPLCVRKKGPHACVPEARPDRDTRPLGYVTPTLARVALAGSWRLAHQPQRSSSRECPQACLSGPLGSLTQLCTHASQRARLHHIASGMQKGLKG